MRRTARLFSIAFITLAVGIGIGLYARASVNVPGGFAYSGVLKNNGVPESAPHTFVFDLLDGTGASTGCTDTRAALQVTDGRFDVLNLFAGPTATGCASLDTLLGSRSGLAVKITVDGVALSPAQPLGTVPFAARARVAERLDNRIIARYHVTAGGMNNIPPTAHTIVNFDTKDFDTTNGAVTTGANWAFSAPVTGYYHVTANVVFAPTDATQHGIDIFVNGSYYSQGTISDVGSVHGVEVSDIVLLNAGDKLDIQLTHYDSHADSLYPDPGDNWINIYMLP